MGEVTSSRAAPESPSPRLASSLRRRGRRGGSLTLSLNLTPMIDVVFLLIFFFLTVSRFGASEGMLPARLPARGAVPAAEVPRTPIYVRLVAPAQPGGLARVTIDRFQVTPIPLAALLAKLASIRDEVPGFDGNTPVILVAGDEVPWDDVVNAYNAAIAAEYRKVLFAADRSDTGEGR